MENSRYFCLMIQRNFYKFKEVIRLQHSVTDQAATIFIQTFIDLNEITAFSEAYDDDFNLVKGEIKIETINDTYRVKLTIEEFKAILKKNKIYSLS